MSGKPFTEDYVDTDFWTWTVILAGLLNILRTTEVDLSIMQHLRWELFLAVVNHWNLLNIVTKSSVFDVVTGPKSASDRACMLNTSSQKST